MYPHMPILRPHAARFHERRTSSVTFTSTHFYGDGYLPVGVAYALADSSDFGLLGSKVYKNGRFPALDADEPRCKIRRRYRFILRGEIRNRTNKQTNKITQNAVNDISTPCLSTCVDNKFICTTYGE